MHIDRQRASASQIRPLKLYNTFLEMGYEVDLVEGYGKERKQQISKIKRNIKAGKKYEFMYSESSTMPTLLTEKHHLPTYPCLDFSFFAFCKKHGIPIGLFYRDIHWCYINKDKDFKQRVAKYFYRYDLQQYKKLLDTMFLPSIEMMEHIPFSFDKQVLPLPAGCNIHHNPAHKFNGTLNILYIGGIGGNYDLRLFVKAVTATPMTSLTICCRQDDWESVKSQYEEVMNDQIHITHKQGEELAELYSQADIFTMFFTNDYIKFAVPFKLFDTMGYNMPIIAPTDTWTGNLIHTHNAGISCENSFENICEALTRLINNPELLIQFRHNMEQLAPLNTWEYRSAQIASALSHPSNSNK